MGLYERSGGFIKPSISSPERGKTEPKNKLLQHRASSNTVNIEEESE